MFWDRSVVGPQCQTAGRRGGESAEREAGLGTLSLSFRFFAPWLHPRRACAPFSAFCFSSSLGREPEPQGGEGRAGSEKGRSGWWARQLWVANATRHPSSPLSLSGEDDLGEVRKELVVILQDPRGPVREVRY